MNERIRQMVLGLGTFGTGTALLMLNVNPLLLVLTDSVVGVGMLFAAGSITREDFRMPQKSAPAGEPAAAQAAHPGEEAAKKGLMSSLGKMKPSFVKGKKEQEEEQEKIDLMLDSALVGQSRRIINLAEGQPAPSAGTVAATPAALAAALEAPGKAGGARGAEDGADIPARLLQEVTGEDEEGETAAGQPGLPGAGGFPAVPPATAGELGAEELGAGREGVLQLTDGGMGADDLLSALRREAMREKKKDDSSLLRNLKGVKVTGRELLTELDLVVREIKGR